MTNETSGAATPPQSLTVPAGRLASIAYNCVGIHTEAGAAPYTRIVNAGGASGLSVGVFQNDFALLRRPPRTRSGWRNRAPHPSSSSPPILRNGRFGTNAGTG